MSKFSIRFDMKICSVIQSDSKTLRLKLIYLFKSVMVEKIKAKENFQHGSDILKACADTCIFFVM